MPELFSDYQVISRIFVRSVRLSLEFLTGQSLISFDVFFAGFYRDVFGQLYAGTRFVEIDAFKIIADELLVEALLVPAGLVFIGRPEAGRVRR